MKTIKNYLTITFSTLIMAVGVYFFKFPNNFCFGGVTGFAVVVARIFPISASVFTFCANIVLLVIGFIFLGKDFAIKTTYSSVLLSLMLLVLEKIYPMTAPLSNEPTLELLFAIALPAIGSAILFNIGASSGGTDVLAMLLKRYTNAQIGSALMLTDLVAILIACFVFDIKTAMYSFVGLVLKSFLIDGIIESIHLCKAVTIICDHPEDVCDFIVHRLNRDATITEASGAFTCAPKSMVVTVLSRAQAIQLREFVHRTDPKAFILIYSTSEVIGKGFVTI